ncbi:thiosulfate sulfurtransferase GlpE [bacterium BMS3Bbin10]|nr:thiosulfate sulfurtransferase GlpE [bacterium BMS3Bbin10]
MGDFFISPAGLRALLGRGAAPVILDIRKRAAFDASGLKLPGAEWRDPHDIACWIGDLAKDTPLIVHCVHGHEVSQLAGQTLRDAGLDARVLFGGIEGWRDAGGEVVPAAQNIKPPA